MSTLLVVCPEGANPQLPAALTMLPHTVEVVAENSARLSAGDADVVIVDARADLLRGRDACVAVRTRTNAPVLILVMPAALSVLQRSWGLDDFVLDTAESAELDARIRVLAASTAASSTISSGAIVIDEDAYTAKAGDRSLDLTYTEFELLKYLAMHPGRVLTREHLLSEVWGYDYYGGTRTVDVHIRRLRAKLGPEHEGHVTTVRNVGYRFQANTR